MSYIDNGITGLALRGKLNNQLTKYVNVLDYGADSTGINDSLTAITAAINEMATNGGIVIIPRGTYKMSSGINIQSFSQSKSCEIIGIGKVTLDFSTMTDVMEAFDLGSTKSDTAVFTTNLTKGGLSIVSGLSVVKNDIITIISTDLWGGTEGSGCVKRELAVVAGSSAGTITLKTPLWDNYDKTTTTIANLNSARVILRNIKIIGNPALESIAFSLRYFNNVLIENVEIVDFYQQSLTLLSCYFGNIRNCKISGSNLTGFGYGIQLTNCQDILVDSSEFYNNVFGITMGTNTKNCVVQNCHLYPSAGSVNCIDNHPGCENVTIKDNFCNGGGILLKGINNNVLNNTIYAYKNIAGIQIQSYGYGTMTNDYLNIIGNKVITIAGTTKGIYILFEGNDDYIKNINVSDNNFKTSSYCLSANITGAPTGNRIGNLIINNNIFETTADISAVYVFAGVKLDCFKLQGGKITSLGVGITIIGDADSGNAYFDNVILSCVGNPVVTYTSDLTNTFIKDCHLISDGYLNLLATSNIILQNNIMENMIKGGIKINAGTSVYTHGGNVKINCTGVVENAATVTNDGTDY